MTTEPAPEPRPEPQEIAPKEPPPFTPDDELIDTFKKNEPKGESEESRDQAND